jgi:hypothetical protein
MITGGVKQNEPAKYGIAPMEPRVERLMMLRGGDKSIYISNPISFSMLIRQPLR